MLARDALHFRQHVAHMLGMLAVLAARDVLHRLGQRERGFIERFADVLTDALRAALLRLHGYRVDVVEFVDSRHTPRNVLLRARRTGAPPTEEQRAEYARLVGAWGVTPALAKLLPGFPAA